MKSLYYYILAILCSLFFVACSDKNNEILSDITLKSPVDNIVLPSNKNAEYSIEFVATSTWKAKTDVEWATVFPQSGKAGNIKISLIANMPNNTGLDRSGIISLIGSENNPLQINFTQTTSEVLLLNQTDFEIPCEGQEIALEFATNVEGKVKLMVYSDVESWIKPVQGVDSRGLVEGAFRIKVLANETRDLREANFQVYVVEPGNESNVLMKSELINISQVGVPVETSSDYSTDKQVKLLQSHTKGNGVPLVILGDGFVDREIAEGYYDKVINKAMENFFTEEPVHSLREYFDVWSVTAVSRNNAFGEEYQTAFECVLEGNGSSGIVGNEEKVLEYISAIKDLKPEKVKEALAIVLLNTSVYAGTTAIGYKLDGDEMTEFAIGYCPVIENLDSETFRRVLCHECIGHGIAKLLDEYSYEEMGEIPLTLIKTYREFQSYGWAMNVDFTSNENDVVWKHLLRDERYQGKDVFGETLGVYEGACTYWTGAWRSTNQSMMRDNINSFNAPSREAIYKRIMSTAYGETWNYDYEEFVQFDQKHLPEPKGSRVVVETKYLKPLHAPIFVNKTFLLK